LDQDPSLSQISLDVTATGAVIQGNYIGLGLNGLTKIETESSSIYDGIELWSSEALVGGPSEAARNIISGHPGAGILLRGGEHNTIQGNYIGTDASGRYKVGNEIGIDTERYYNSLDGYHYPTANMIGGNASDTGNIIAGNESYGIRLKAGATQNLIYSNNR